MHLSSKPGPVTYKSQDTGTTSFPASGITTEGQGLPPPTGLSSLYSRVFECWWHSHGCNWLYLGGDKYLTPVMLLCALHTILWCNGNAKSHSGTGCPFSSHFFGRSMSEACRNLKHKHTLDIAGDGWVDHKSFCSRGSGAWCCIKITLYKHGPGCHHHLGWGQGSYHVGESSRLLSSQLTQFTFQRFLMGKSMVREMCNANMNYELMYRVLMCARVKCSLMRCHLCKRGANIGAAWNNEWIWLNACLALSAYHAQSI